MCKYNFNAFQTLLLAAVKNIRRKYIWLNSELRYLYINIWWSSRSGLFWRPFCCVVLDKRDLSARVLTLCILKYSRILKYSSTGICNVPFCLKLSPVSKRFNRRQPFNYSSYKVLNLSGAIFSKSLHACVGPDPLFIIIQLQVSKWKRNE